MASALWVNISRATWASSVSGASAAGALAASGVVAPRGVCGVCCGWPAAARVERVERDFGGVGLASVRAGAGGDGAGASPSGVVVGVGVGLGVELRDVETVFIAERNP